MKIEVWSDVVCPWCYVGSRHLTEALASFAHADAVEVEWKAYELDPHAPVEREGGYVRHLATKYGISPTEARARLDRLVAAGVEAGIEFRLEDARPGNTFDAHRLLRLASDEGIQERVKDRLFAPYFTEARPIGDCDTLVELAAEAGVDEARTRRVLDGDEYAAAVRADEAEARELGVQGVPFFAFDRRRAVAGAQPPQVLLAVLERVWSKSS